MTTCVFCKTTNGGGWLTIKTTGTISVHKHVCLNCVTEIIGKQVGVGENLDIEDYSKIASLVINKRNSGGIFYEA